MPPWSMCTRGTSGVRWPACSPACRSGTEGATRICARDWPAAAAILTPIQRKGILWAQAPRYVARCSSAVRQNVCNVLASSTLTFLPKRRRVLAAESAVMARAVAAVRMSFGTNMWLAGTLSGHGVCTIGSKPTSRCIPRAPGMCALCAAGRRWRPRASLRAGLQ